MTDGLNLTINVYEKGIDIKCYTLPLGEEVKDVKVIAELLAKSQLALFGGAMNEIQRRIDEEN
jgi:hypothetical protein